LSDIPKLKVTFGNLKVNGVAIENPTASAIYPKDVPDYADAKADGKSIEIIVGEEVKNREKRNVKLITNKE
jgi:hypothetical protein